MGQSAYPNPASGDRRMRRRDDYRLACLRRRLLGWRTHVSTARREGRRSERTGLDRSGHTMPRPSAAVSAHYVGVSSAVLTPPQGRPQGGPGSPSGVRGRAAVRRYPNGRRGAAGRVLRTAFSEAANPDTTCRFRPRPRAAPAGRGPEALPSRIAPLLAITGSDDKDRGIQNGLTERVRLA